MAIIDNIYADTNTVSVTGHYWPTGTSVRLHFFMFRESSLVPLEEKQPSGFKAHQRKREEQQKNSTPYISIHVQTSPKKKEQECKMPISSPPLDKCELTCHSEVN